MASCKDCTKRYVGCHSNCADYAEYKKEVTEQRKQKRKESMMNKHNFDSRNRHSKPRLNYWSIFKTDKYKEEMKKKGGYTQCTLF